MTENRRSGIYGALLYLLVIIAVATGLLAIDTHTVRATMLHEEFTSTGLGSDASDEWRFEVTGISMYGSGDQTVKLIAFTDKGDPTENIVIPASVGYDTSTPYAVTAIGSGGVFTQHVNIKSVTIPDSVIVIGDGAFAECYNAESLTLGNSVEIIGVEAFYSFGILTENGSGSLQLPNTVTNILRSAFYTSGFTGDLVLPNSLTHMAQGAFAGCDGFTSLTIGSGLTTIPMNAFEQCLRLNGNLSIPGNVGTIGKYAFKDCTGITSLTLNNGLTGIGEEAFNGCTRLASSNIPAGITGVGKNAFANTAALTVTFDNGCSSVPDNAFEDCKTLKSVAMPDTMRTIGLKAFNGCSELETVDFGTGLVTIGNYAFQLCEKLGTVTMPDTVTSLGTFAFNKCYGLNSLTLSKGLTSISNTAFQTCSSLPSVTIPYGVTIIDQWAFNNCSSLTEVDIPNSVETIGKNAFKGCISLHNLNLPASVRYINNTAFLNCSSLEELILPEGVTNVGGQAFDGCIGLTGKTLTLPSTLVVAYNQSFGNRYFTKVINNSETVFDHYSFLKPDDGSDFFYADEKTGEKAEKLGKGTYILTNTFGRLTGVDVPAGQTLTYNGKVQTGVAAGTGYDLSGTFSATDAGSYEARASLKEGFKWSDGTTEDKTISWRINKAVGEIAVPKAKKLTYNGKNQTGVKAGDHYTLSGTTKAKNAGKYKAIATLDTDKNYTFKWSDGNTESREINWSIGKAANTLKIKAKTTSVPYSKVKSKTQKVDVSKVIQFIKKGQGTKTYTKSSGDKKITIDKKSGKVSVKKGIKKKSHKVKVKVKAAGNKNYKSSTATVTFTIRVK